MHKTIFAGIRSPLLCGFVTIPERNAAVYETVRSGMQHRDAAKKYGLSLNTIFKIMATENARRGLKRTPKDDVRSHIPAEKSRLKMDFCITCRAPFLSAGAHNRLCDKHRAVHLSAWEIYV